MAVASMARLRSSLSDMALGVHTCHARREGERIRTRPMFVLLPIMKEIKYWVGHIQRLAYQSMLEDGDSTVQQK
jgi:hypothetical protein